MFCYTPNISVCNATRSMSDDSPASSDDVKLLISILGFILDGDTNYKNLSEHKDLPSRLAAYEPPQIDKMKSTVQYKSGVPLEIKVIIYLYSGLNGRS